MKLTAAQERYYREIEAATKAGGDKRYNGHARRVLKVLVEKGLITVDAQSFPIARLGRGVDIGFRYVCKTKAPLNPAPLPERPLPNRLALRRAGEWLRLAAENIASARAVIANAEATVIAQAESEMKKDGQ